ncbi:hypothetical protein HPB52_015923 [Rhipicephalus sanguineus]|uniref:Uncharacterized protein n=1 Tax=Rhipicephalus sanguineus TaxID=34632 RepID=A0A9D4SZ44_RHISA|nr:hypothetical protein HPB52_015923 [Rhipicephalus sanguineus]
MTVQRSNRSAVSSLVPIKGGLSSFAASERAVWRKQRSYIRWLVSGLVAVTIGGAGEWWACARDQFLNYVGFKPAGRPASLGCAGVLLGGGDAA